MQEVAEILDHRRQMMKQQQMQAGRYGGGGGHRHPIKMGNKGGGVKQRPPNQAEGL